jgi:hypothetical protein
MTISIRITLIAACLLVYLGAVTTQHAQAQAPTAQTTASEKPGSELVGRLTKELSITPEQAIGGSGALFGLAKTRLKPEEFTKVADAVPGIDGLLKAAPKPKQGSAGMLGAMGGMLPGKAGGLASVAGSFKSLGLSPGMAVKFVPIMAKFAEVKGGASVGNLLSGALK